MVRYQFCLTAEVEENIFPAVFWFIITSRIKHDFSKTKQRKLGINLQSQSKFLGHFSVFTLVSLPVLLCKIW